MNDRIKILGIPIDNVDFNETYAKAGEFLAGNECKTIFTPNSEMLYMGYKDKEFGDILSRGSLILPDGAGVILASKLIGKSLKAKVSGVDVSKGMLSRFPLRVFLLGGKPGITEKAAENIEKEYESCTIAGFHHGYFKEDEDDKIIEMINAASPDLLIVGMGMKKQEKWIETYRERLNVKIAIGAGGTLDVLSGAVTLTPEFIRKTGFEWLHRLLRDPKRYKRMSVIPLFLILAVFKRKH